MNVPQKPFNLGLTVLILLALFLSSTLVARPVSAASIVVDTDYYGFTSDGKCSLSEAIYNANNDSQIYTAPGECATGSAGVDTITFAENYTITLAGSQLPIITSEIIITGNGAANTIIQASTCNPVTLPGGCTPATYAVFEVNATGSLTLDSVTVRHGNAYSGGGINNEGMLTVTNSTISANNASVYGGGIINEGTETNTTVTSSTFTGNVANQDGGGVYNILGNLTVTSSTFSGNVANQDGGGISNIGGNLTVNSSTFSGNVANQDGGGIINEGTETSTTVTSSTFSGNVANQDGGGVYNILGNLTVTSSTFSGNVANQDGGGIFNEGELTIYDSTLSGNNAKDSGGGIYNMGSLGMSKCTLFDNTSEFGGGIYNHESGYLFIDNSTLSRNEAAVNGGGIDNWGNLYIFNITLSGNVADYGGGINNRDELRFVNTIIAGSTGGDCVNNGTINTISTHNLVQDGSCQVDDLSNINGDPKLGPLANNGGPTWTHALLPGSPAIDAGVGGGPPIDQRGVKRPQGAGCDIGAFEVEYRVVTNNANDGDGSLRQAITDISPGGIITFAENYTITLGNRLPKITSSITIIGNGAENTIIQASECNPVTLEPVGCTPVEYNVFEVASSGSLTLDGVTVRHGNAYSGGGINNEGMLTVTNSTISANKALVYGGGIFSEGDDAATTVTNSTFSNNETFNEGGGISNLYGTLSVTSSTFSHNVADNGGGISNTFGTLTVTSNTFSHNEASFNGGGIYNFFAASTSTVTSSNFSENTAYNGGAIYTNCNLKIMGSTFSGNQATFKGGGVFNKGTLEVDQSTFLANDADLGGGIRNDEGIASKITLTASTFRENTAAHGGAIDNWGDGPNLVNTSSLIENIATANGGAIRNWSVLTVENSTISGNTASGTGGGVRNEGTLTIENSTFSDNSTDGEGGGLLNEGTLTLLNVALNGNEAGSGGGIYTIYTLNMTGSTLTGNSAYEGGGIYNLSNLEITKSTLSGNTAIEDGGGILNVGTLNITNSTLSGNTASRDGGGILNDGSLNLLHVTLYENIAEPGGGGGIINFDGSTLKFINTIVAHSTGGDCVNLDGGPIDIYSTHNLVQDGSCQVYDLSNINGDPKLGPLADNGGPTWTHALLPGSPAIDAGVEGGPTIDQRGVTRPKDGDDDGVPGYDIGAFEFDPAIDGVNLIYLPLILLQVP